MMIMIAPKMVATITEINMTDNFDNALRRAKVLINKGMEVNDVIKEVVDDYALTQYEENELETELDFYD